MPLSLSKLAGSRHVVQGTSPGARGFSSPGGHGLRLDQGRRQAEMIGLLAGSGRFPILFAEAAQRQGLQVACVGI